MDIAALIDLYIKEGYKEVEALAKVSQDIILIKISKTSFSKNITIKGGVVMHNISKNKRRSTRDIDFDFIKYSLSENSIREFIEKLNKVNDEISVTIDGEIEKLNHQDYDGKRVNIILTDKNNYKVFTKLDIGVHKDFDIVQEEYSFNLDIINESISLLINSNEQIFTEKLKSLLKFAYISTRYKDIFDLYYLIKFGNLNKEKMEKYITKIILNDTKTNVRDYEDIHKKLKLLFNNKRFVTNLNNVKENWLDVSINEVINTIISYIEEYIKIEV